MSIDLYAGDWVGASDRPWHPKLLLTSGIHWFAQKLNRVDRTRHVLMIRGIVTVCIFLGSVTVAGISIHYLALIKPMFGLIELLLVIAVLDLRRPWQKALALADAIEHGGLLAGKRLISTLSDRDPSYVDQPELARIIVETMANLFVLRAVGPVFSYLLFGLAGLYAHCFLVLCYTGTERAAPFYMASHWLHSLMVQVSAVISAPLFLLATLAIPEVRSKDALLGMLLHLRRYPAKFNKLIIAATASGLGLSLGGPRKYLAGLVEHPWIGTGTPDAQPAHIRAAAKWYFYGCLVIYGVVIICSLFS